MTSILDSGVLRAMRQRLRRRRLIPLLAGLTAVVSITSASAGGLSLTSQDLTTSGPVSGVYFGATDVGNSSCSVPTTSPFTCTTSNAAKYVTTNGRPELVLVDLVGSQSAGTVMSSISGPFTGATQLTSVDYPSSSDKQVLYLWTATGNGTTNTITVAFSNKNGTANVEVVQLNGGNSLVSSSLSTAGGTTGTGVSTFSVAITPHNAADSEIAFLGTDKSNSFTPTPSGWTQLPSSAPTNWNAYSSPIIASPTTFTISSSKQDWGYIAMEVSP